MNKYKLFTKGDFNSEELKLITKWMEEAHFRGEHIECFCYSDNEVAMTERFKNDVKACASYK